MRSPTSPKCKPHRHSGAVALHNRALHIMRERKENVQRQPAERARGVELLRYRHKADRALVETVHETGEIEKRPAQSIHLIYNDAIYATALDILEQPLERRAFEIAAG